MAGAGQSSGQDDSSARPSLLRWAGEVGFRDESKALSKQRKNLSRLRGTPSKQPRQSRATDFLDIVSLVCEIYQSYVGNLIPMQQFHRTWELDEDAGHTCIVTSRAISSPIPSLTNRGETALSEGKVIVKRTKRAIFGTEGSAIHTLVNELRIRSHAPLRGHPNIVNLKGIAWDFENSDETRPRPLLVEEFAPHRALDTFWDNNDLVRMPLLIKVRLCRDVAEGINALHACGIAHGDIKPGNILIFPNTDAEAQKYPFTAKLTDFGHSVCDFEKDPTLPIWTPSWSAPEADPDTAGGEQIKSFQDIMATDIYSYGLVAVSIIIGASIVSGDFSELKDAATIAASKADDTLMSKVIEVVTREDRTHPDSDFDLGMIIALLKFCLGKLPASRSISDSIKILQSYEDSCSTEKSEHFFWEARFLPRRIEAPSATQPPLLIGYRTLHKCSHLVKSKIVDELRKTALDRSDRRRAACAWELCICYFSGFGVMKDWAESRKWLTEAAVLGVESAQAFYIRLHDAMDHDPLQTLQSWRPTSGEHEPYSEEDATALVSEWLVHAVSIGCVDILQDMRIFDQATGCSSFEDAMAGLKKEFGVGASSNAQDSSRTLKAAVSGDLKDLQSAIESRPKSIEDVDLFGNNALILAAKFGNADVLRFLLQHPATKVKHFNNNHQSVLHFMPIFSDSEIGELVPELVGKGADLSQEGLALVYSSDAPTSAIPVRCCPLLNAIVQRRIVLLEQLLNVSHLEKSSLPCGVCAAGSRFRKIVAVSAALHCYEAIDLLHAHLQKHGKAELAVLEGIEVWYQNELLPLRRVPFHGIYLRGLDLPEPFLRALFHGSNSLVTQKKTLSCILDKSSRRKDTLYAMISDSTLHDAVDALNHLLNVDDGFRNDELWSYAIKEGFYENPLFLSIRNGFHSVFERLVGSMPDNIQCLPTDLLCRRSCCGYWRASRHVINMAHLCISVAVTSAHCDLFFIQYILDGCSEHIVLAQPCEYDEEISGQPSAFMAQAILAFADRSAHLIAKRYPTLLGQVVPQLPCHKRYPKSESYTSAAQSVVLSGDDIVPAKWMSLSNYVFLIGSTSHCHLLQTLKVAAGHKVPPHNFVAPSCGNDVELGQLTDAEPSGEGWNWRDYPLSASEFQWLLIGLIADTREDRQTLWELVKHQLDSGSRRPHIDMYYLRLAIRYGNYVAVDKLCQVSKRNGARWRLRLAAVSPLDLARLTQLGGYDMFPVKRHTIFGWPTMFKLTIPRLKFTPYDKAKIERTITTLRNHGFKSSSLWKFASWKVQLPLGLAWALGVLPISCLISRSSTPGLKGFVFGWSISATITAHFVALTMLGTIFFFSPLMCFGPRTQRPVFLLQALPMIVLPLLLIVGYFCWVPAVLRVNMDLDIDTLDPDLRIVIAVLCGALYWFPSALITFGMVMREIPPRKVADHYLQLLAENDES